MTRLGAVLSVLGVVSMSCEPTSSSAPEAEAFGSTDTLAPSVTETVVEVLSDTVGDEPDGDPVAEDLAIADLADEGAVVETDVPEVAIPEDANPEDAAPEDVAPDVATPDIAEVQSDVGTPVEPLGTFANPIEITSFPFTHHENTSAAPGATLTGYSPCAPATNESGGEVVYRLSVAVAGTLSAIVDDVSGDAIDVDVHLLEAPSTSACVARDNVALTHAVTPGTWWIVVDTWVDGGGVAKPGPYTLTVSWKVASADPCGPSSCVETDLPTPNGVPTEPAGQGGCPPGMAFVDTFCIDRWEAALVEVEPSGALLPWSPFQHPSGTVRAVSAEGLVPQGYISGTQAAAACAEAGKRLCSDAEWLRACRGVSDWSYPYGTTRVPGWCNDARACHPAVQYFGTGAAWIWSELGHPCLNQLPDGLDPSGANAECVTPEGIFDLMGNLHEWTSAPEGTFRGGFYVDTKLNGEGCLYKTTAHDVSHWDYSTGFRCCKDP